MKFLIVDDDKKNLYILESLLKGHGHEVITASNGIEALDTARDRLPDLIITDIMMPGMDGFSLCHKCKLDENLKNIPLVVYSATYTDHKDEELAMALGASMFLTKPVEPEEFMRLLAEAIKAHKDGNLPTPEQPLKNGETLKHMHEEVLQRKLTEKLRELAAEREALRESEETYRRLFSTVSDAIIIFDAGTLEFIDVNDAALNLYGYTKDEFLKSGLYDISAEPEETTISVKKTLAEGLHRIPLRLHKKKDGSVFPAEISSNVFKMEGRDVICGIIRDITERRNTEQELQESDERFKRLSQASFEGIVISENGKVIDANRQLAEMLGYNLEDLIGIEVWKFVAPEDREMVSNHMKNQSDVPYEHRALCKDGSQIIIEAHGQTINYKRKKVRLTAIRDVTERKKLESHLMHTQKMESIGTLAGGIAHDFNNILTAIIGFANLIKMKIDKDSVLMSNVDHIISSSNKAAYLTRSLLAFSRKQIINLQPLKINDVIQNLKKFLIRIVGEDIELSIALTGKNPTIRADSIQIDQVLMNLATNARDAMPDSGGLTITTECVNLTDEFIEYHGYGERGMYACLSVTDTGIGMDEGVKSKIFEPFFTTKEVGEGTGLGMSVLYGIIKQHNGFVNLYSEPGKGTTFKIYFPMIESEVEKIHETIITLERGTETILLAEDDEMARILAKTVLEEFGYTVIEAVNGTEAVEKFINNKDGIDLLMLDVIMPKRNGKQVYEDIKEMRPDMKALFSSGYPKDVIHKRGILDKDLNFISKPLSPQQLLRKVRDILDS